MRRVAFILALLGVCAVPTAAASVSSASGTVENTSAVFNSVRTAGTNLIVDVTATASYTGTFTGTSVINGTLIIHSDGSASFHDVEVFTGTVNGVSGTVTFALNGSNDAGLSYQATSTIVDSSGGLSGLHGVLHQSGHVIIPLGPQGMYSGNVG